MWKLSILLLIVINLFAFGDSPVYEPPTDAQLWSWWNRLTPAEQLAELRKLDNVEHAVPEVSGMDLVPILLDSGDLVLTMQSPVLVKIDYLEYAITFPDQIVSKFYIPDKQESKVPTILTWSGIGIVSGFIIAMILK